MPRDLTNTEQQQLEKLLQDKFGLYNALVMQPSDANAAVHGFAVVETLLQRLLERNVNRKGVVRWFDMAITRRVELARAFGEIRDEVGVAIQKFAEIRNGLAHNPGFTLLEKDVAPFQKAMSKALPTEMGAVVAKGADGNLLIMMYGEHGRIFRIAALLLALDLRITLDKIPLDPLVLIEAIEGYWKRPASSMQIFTIQEPFDRQGKRVRDRRKIIRGDASSKDTPEPWDPHET